MTDCIGIIAGTGDLVSQVIESCQSQGQSYVIAAFENQTDTAIVDSHPHFWTKLGKIGHTLQLLKHHNVNKIIMAGRFRRPAWHELRPDLTGMLWIHKLRHAFGDDSLLKVIIALLEQEGFQVISPESLVGQCLFINSGPVTKAIPDQSFLSDIRRGQYILDSMSALDVGQAVVVQQGITLGIEAIEGTDALIARCDQYRLTGLGPVLIKMCKQGQETRVDRATVGSGTLDNLIRYNYAGLAVKANNVIVLNTSALRKQADDAGLFIYGT